MDTKELLGRVCGSINDNEICIYNCGDGAYMRLIKNASKSDFLKSAASARDSATRSFSAMTLKKTSTHRTAGICSSTHISVRLKNSARHMRPVFR